MSKITADRVFVDGVVTIMRDEKIGLEPAIANFSETCRGMIAPIEAEADITRGAELARKLVQQARELVELADRAPAEPEPDAERCAYCGLPMDGTISGCSIAWEKATRAPSCGIPNCRVH